MASTPLFSARVSRVCRVRTGTDSDNAPFPVDADGFLDETVTLASSGEALTPGMLVDPKTAASAGSLVLLGEPGVGKSTVFADLTAGLPDLDDTVEGEHGLLSLNAARLTDASFRELLGRHLEMLPRVAHAKAVMSISPSTAEGLPAARTDVALTIVLDQVDESPMLLRLAGELGRALKGRDAFRVRVLLACRAADYPGALTDVLRASFGGCVLADLAPLTRQEAVALATSAGVDGEAVVAAAVAAGAGGLASVPLTLEFLVRTFRRLGKLEGSPAELFGYGVRLLADEHDDDRRPVVEAATSVDERFGPPPGRWTPGLCGHGRW